ncbi:helix-turn-helix domain-containing protein [Roseimaritima sediminicola]|uniref:helix-turn-helix domain-containing protein n=1 Tax=Roseimaritima sediminicola TaxID=2662066 RepID=UPI0012984DCB
MTHTHPLSNPAERLRTVAEIAEITGTSTSFIYREIRDRKIAVYRLRGQIRIDVSSLADYLERHHQTALAAVTPQKKHF